MKHLRFRSTLNLQREISDCNNSRFEIYKYINESGILEYFCIVLHFKYL